MEFIVAIEPRDEWMRAAAILISSLNEIKCVQAPSVSILVPVSGASTVARLDGLQTPVTASWRNLLLQFSTIDRVHEYPTLNKLNMLPNSIGNQDLAVILDHDMIVAEPKRFAAYLHQLSVDVDLAAVTNRNDGATNAFGHGFDSYFQKITSRKFSECPYVNAGMVAVRRRVADSIANQWSICAEGLLMRYPPTGVPRPYGNTSLSLAISKGNFSLERLPSDFNQRDWGDLPAEPAVIHYNNISQENERFKTRALTSWRGTQMFLEDPPNRFWKTYAESILSLVPSASELHEVLRATLNELAL